MPTYEYRCAKGHTFEVFQRMSDEPVSSCPDCGADAERVLSGGGGFLFKGEGFYITDYRSEDYKKKAEAERSTSPDAAREKAAGASTGSRDRAAGGGGSEKGAKTERDKGTDKGTGKGAAGRGDSSSSSSSSSSGGDSSSSGGGSSSSSSRSSGTDG